jgi:hypothetical protein
MRAGAAGASSATSPSALICPPRSDKPVNPQPIGALVDKALPLRTRAQVALWMTQAVDDTSLFSTVTLTAA